MSEEFQVCSHRSRCDECKRKDSIGIHQLHDFKWLCERCYNILKSEKAAPYVDWSTRETVDNLTEAMHYFAELYRKQDYTTLNLVETIDGDYRGTVCNIMEMYRETTDNFGFPFSHYHRYYQLYNREYLHYGDRVFERATAAMRGEWQTVHKHVIDRAAADNNSGKFKDNVAIVIVMQNKTVWYINPSKFQTFAFEYETEHQSRGESKMQCSIPISKQDIISRDDPFFQ